MNKNKQKLTKEEKMELILSFLIIITIIIAVIVLFATSSNSSNNEKDINVSRELFVSENSSSTEKIKYENKKVFEVNEEERELLAKLVSCEAGVCSDECKKAVVSVVFNRLQSEKWGNSITEVINYPCAFTPVLTGKINTEIADQDCYDAVDYVLEFGCTLPEEVRYFRDDYDFSWDGYKNYVVLSNMYFGYFEDWRNGEW